MRKYIKPGTFALALIACCLPALAQTHVVKGAVTDGKVPLSAISVYEKNHGRNGVITDGKGEFSLTLIDPADSIVINGVGFISQSVLPDITAPMTITLQPDVKGLNDVVVTGYGQKQKAITMTGAVSSVTGDIIRQSPTASLQNALAGRLPGLFAEQRSGQPGNDASQLQIRGVSTYNSPSSQTPLLLIDDIESNYSQLAQLDPYTVESVTILKDASTTAIYGVRGANGVIIVTTIRGKAGRPNLSFTGQTAAQVPTDLPKLNSGYVTLELLREYLLQQGQNPATTYPQFFSGNSLDYYKNNSDPYGHPDVDWWNVLMRKYAPQSTLNLNVTGGSEKIRYAISLGYITQGGIYKDFTKDQGYNGNYFNNRFDYRSNIDIDPTKTLHIRLDLAGTFQITNIPNDKSWNGGGNTFQYLWNQQLSSFGYPVYNPNGSLGDVINPANSGTTKPNPVANLMYSGYQRTFDNNFNSVLSATQQLNFITKGLSVNGLLSFQSDYQFMKALTRSSSQILTYYYNAADSSYTPATTNLYRNGPLSRSFTPYGTYQWLTLQASLDYNRDFGDHHVDGLLLYYKNTKTNNTVSSNVVTPGTPQNTLNSPVMRLDYNFKQRYMFQFDATHSGSDRFGNGHQFSWFPAVSAGWNIAEEPFFKNNIHFIDLLKIRGSYGLTGSDNVGGYQYLYVQTYNSTSNPYYFGATSTSMPGLVEGTLGNPNVTWEKEKKTDIGTDIKMFHGALSITADYFHNFRYGILSTRLSAPATIGVGLPPLNLGKVKNNGYEIDIRYNGRGKDLTWFVDGQVSYAKNTIVFMDEPPQPYPWMAQTGHSIGGQFGYVWTGKLYQNISQLFEYPTLSNAVPMSNLFPGGLIFKDLNNDGVINTQDVAYLGTNQPPLTGGLSFGFSYKSFDLSVLFNGSFDYIVNIQRGLTNYTERATYASIPYVLDNRWTPANASSATYPALNGGVTLTSAATSLGTTNSSSYWYHNGDYVRLKNVEIGYSFSNAFAKKLHVKSLRVYLSGYNLWLVFNQLHVPIDPESVFSSSVGEYPQERVFNGGFTIGL